MKIRRDDLKRMIWSKKYRTRFEKIKFYKIKKISYRIIIEKIPRKDSTNGKYLIISQKFEKFP